VSFVVWVEERECGVETATVVFVKEMREFVADEIIDDFWRRHDYFPIVGDCIVAACAAEYAVCAVSRARTPTGAVGANADARCREIRAGFGRENSFEFVCAFVQVSESFHFVPFNYFCAGVDGWDGRNPEVWEVFAGRERVGWDLGFLFFDLVETFVYPG